jgi:hypothetical protein
MEGLGVISDAAFTFDDQDAGFTARVSNMLTPDFCEEHVTDLQCDYMLDSRSPVVHVDSAIEDSEYFFAVVHVPLVRLICPMKACRGTRHVGYVLRTPRSACLELLAADHLHCAISPNVL